jgi:hypothetical protein
VFCADACGQIGNDSNDSRTMNAAALRLAL